jgi:hypothetical protein
MLFRKSIAIPLVVAFIASASVAYADNYSSVFQGVRLLQRCDSDMLSDSDGIGRVHWYANCYPDRVKADMEAVLGEAIGGSTQALEIYYDFMGFHRNAAGEWVPKGVHVFYPLFEREPFDSWHAPTEALPQVCIAIPAGYRFTMSCRSSCYTPSMRLAFPEGDIAIKTASDAKTPKVTVLADDSTLDDIKTASVDVFGYVTSKVEQEHEILTFETASGGLLEVTTNHPLLDGGGYLREARTFGVGDALVRADNSLDEIVKVTPWKYFGKVYNIAPNSETKLGNVVIAEGFLSGSELYQNEWKNMLDSQLLRANIPAEALE